MGRVLRLIPNFVRGIWTGALWRLCASSRWANHRSVFYNIWLRLYECQLLQENVNEIRNTVNDLRMTVNLPSIMVVNLIRK